MHNYCYIVRLYDKDLIQFKTYFNGSAMFPLFMIIASLETIMIG